MKTKRTKRIEQHFKKLFYVFICFSTLFVTASPDSNRVEAFDVVFQEQKTITGTITDETGLPLPGATVLEVGTSNGTTTDFDGNFTIEVGDDAFVSISYVGYQTLTLASNADFSKISLSFVKLLFCTFKSFIS